MTVALLVLLFAAAGFAFYEWSAARRWEQTADDWKQESGTYQKELEEQRRIAIEQRAEVEKTREVADVQIKLLTQTQQQLEERFRALAVDALQRNSQMLLERNKEQVQLVVEPVSQSLKRFEENVQALEKSRTGAYEKLTAQVDSLTQLQERVRKATDDLKTALRSPVQRGRWGEVQLRRVVELAGMLEYCDFAEQETLFGERNQRPDLIVRLPNECRVVVDAKVSLDAYLRAVEATDEEQRRKHLADHARQVKNHVKTLGEKAYWQRLTCSPEFVVAFLPLEPLFSAALESDPTLVDFGVGQRVVLATPVTLITLLLTVAHGWRQHALSENAEKIRESGIELYKRVAKACDHFAKLGDAIERTVGVYNDAVGSFERQVLPSARRFRELQPASTAELPELETVDEPRAIDASKWVVNG